MAENWHEAEEACCTIDYAHHKEIFEQRRAAYAKDPDKAVTVHEAEIRLVEDHYKQARVPGGYTIQCDEPVVRGGKGRGPAPLQLLVSSIGL